MEDAKIQVLKEIPPISTKNHHPNHGVIGGGFGGCKRPIQKKNMGSDQPMNFPKKVGGAPCPRVGSRRVDALGATTKDLP